MKFIPDDRTGLVFVAHPDQEASVEIIHRSIDDWRVYKNVAANVGDGLRGLHVQNTYDEERGRSVYVRSGKLHVRGYDTIFINGGGPPDDQVVSAGQMLETISSGVQNAITTRRAVDISAKGIVLANSMETNTEWWCVHTPGFASHDTTMHNLNNVQTGNATKLIQYVFIDADITIHGERQSGECIVARHTPGEDWHDITVHDVAFYFRIYLSGTREDVRWAVRRMDDEPTDPRS